MQVMRLGRSLLACVAVLSLLGCDEGDPGSNERATDTRGAYLSVNTTSGGVSVDAPRHAGEYTATFGSFVLCKGRGVKDVVIDGVRTSSQHEPDQLQVSLRTGGGSPVASILGSPPGFSEPYAGQPLDGVITTEVKGLHVSSSCRQLRRGDAKDVQELLFTMSTGPNGGDIDKEFIDFTADGEPRTLPVNWQMVNCGTAYVDEEFC